MFGGNIKRKKSLKRQISQTERLISLFILVFIICLGATLYIDGEHYDASIFGLDESLLISADQESSETPRASTNGPPSSRNTDLSIGITPENWKIMGEVEFFSPETLYEKINGRADQYLTYDMVKLTCIGFINNSNPNQFIDIFAYDMASPLNAFGIFSLEKYGGQSIEQLGREGYSAETGIFFRKGVYYVQVLASDTNEQLQITCLEIARSIANKIHDSGESIWGLSAFPSKGLMPGSTRFYKKNALGLEFLNDTYTAQYTKNDARYTAFLTKQASPEIASQIFDNYQIYLNDFGKVIEKRIENNATVIIGEMSGIHEAVFQKGPIVGGITSAMSRKLAENAIYEFIAGESPWKKKK